jgi:hypothetical protein
VNELIRNKTINQKVNLGTKMVGTGKGNGIPQNGIFLWVGD